MSSNPSISKKRGRVVPSRFKLAAETFSSQSSKRSVGDAISRSHSPRKSEQSCASGRDELRVIKGENVKCVASTPHNVGCYPMPSCNESVIVSAKNTRAPYSEANLDAPLKDEAKLDLPKIKLGDQTLNTTMFSQQGRKKPNQANQSHQSDIDLLYAEYLQAKLLESRAKKAFQERCKDALDNIYEVWSYVGVLMGQNAKVKKDLNILNYLILVHEHLCNQEEMLLPILKIIPSLEKQYEAITIAVDTARHNVEIKDVAIPDDDCEKEIVQLLRKIQALLRIIINFVQDCDKVVIAAEIKHTFVNQGKLLSEELTRASEMLSEASSSFLTEASLKLSSSNTDKNAN